jgi:hypothetical protein
MAIRSEMDSSFVSRDCPVNINKGSRVLEVAQERAAKIIQTTRLFNMAIRSEMDSTFVSRDCLVNINEVSRVPEAAQE